MQTTTIIGVTYEAGSNTDWTVDDQPAEADGRICVGWINGTATLSDGRTISVGGGWVYDDGSVEAYGSGETGDIAALASALGVDECEAVDRILDLSPSTWPT